MIQMKADFRGWQKGFQNSKDATTSVRVSLTDVGAGVVTTTSGLVATMLRREGGDIFEVPPDMAAHIEQSIARDIKAEMHRAAQTKTNRRAQIRKILREAAKDLLAALIKRVERGNVKKNAPGYAHRKLLSQRRGGRVTREYGMPAPWGVRTGRFIAELKAGWRKAGSRD